LKATIVTIQATLGGYSLALIGGLALAVARLSSFRILRTGAAFWTDAVRCTPLLIQLYFLFFVLPYYGFKFDALMTGILGLGLHYSSFTGEVFRGGILAVPRTQWEAAKALHLSTYTTWSRVVLPQALIPAVPVLGNYLISMFKTSAVLATITVPELLGRALREASITYRFLEPITLIGAIFVCLSLVGAYGVRRVSRQLDLITHGPAIR
jgi:polar amino acid transport system permease protein